MSRRAVRQPGRTDFVTETFFSNMKANDGMKDKLVEDLATLVRDAEELVKVAGGQVAEKTKVELQSALGRLKAGCEKVEKKARAGAHQADVAIREYPYQSIGAAFAIGVLIGVLAGRSSYD